MSTARRADVSSRNWLVGCTQRPKIGPDEELDQARRGVFGEGAGGGDAQQPAVSPGIGDLGHGLLRAPGSNRAAGQPQPARREHKAGTDAVAQRVRRVRTLAQRRDVHGDSGVGKTEFRGGRPYRAQANHLNRPEASRGHALKAYFGKRA